MKASQIKNILLDKLCSDKYYTVSEIKSIIEINALFEEDDYNPYTQTRPSGSYKKWEHNVQSVLYSMKSDNILEHDKQSNTYKLKS